MNLKFSFENYPVQKKKKSLFIIWTFTVHESLKIFDIFFIGFLSIRWRLDDLACKSFLFNIGKQQMIQTGRWFRVVSRVRSVCVCGFTGVSALRACKHSLFASQRFQSSLVGKLVSTRGPYVTWSSVTKHQSKMALLVQQCSAGCRRIKKKKTKKTKKQKRNKKQFVINRPLKKQTIRGRKSNGCSAHHSVG